jgi:cytochrome c oxidase subunit I+III
MGNTDTTNLLCLSSIPHIHQRADGLDVDRLGPELAGGKGYLAHIRNEMMETVAVDAVTGAPNQIIVFPKNSYWPLISALLTGAFFLCFLIKIYILAPLFFIATIVSFFFWAKNPDAKRDRGEVSAGNNLYIPLHYEHADAPSIFAVLVALMSNATLFACLLFGGLFLWISNSGEAMAWQSQISFTNLLFLTVSVLGTLAGIVATLGNSGRLFLQAASALIYLTAIVIGLAAVIPEFQNVTHVFDSIAFTLKSYLILHLVIAFTLSLFCILRYLTGYISPARRNDLKIARSWHLYCLWVLLISAFYLPVLQLIVQRN